jgi:palmitoyltransferase
MDLLWIALTLYLSGAVFFAYFCLFADPEQSQIAYLLTQKLPNSINQNVMRVVGAKRMEKMAMLSEYLLQLFYLVIVLGCWSIVFVYAYPMVAKSEHVSNVHMYIGVIVFLACMASFRQASNASPGYITHRTLAKHDHFPYDNLLFPPDRVCPTVGIRKLARSKYDRFSRNHVARFDHYCGWLRNPIGEENYRFFLLFLVVHVVSCLYGSVVLSFLFYGEVLDKKLLEATFFNPATGQEFKADWFIITQYLFQRHFYISSVVLLMTVMTFVLGGFLTYHVWLTSRGMTTNESVKWGQVRKWHKQESKRYQHAVKNGLVSEQMDASNASSVVTDGDVTCTGAADPAPTANGQRGEKETGTPIYDPGPMPKNIYDNGIVENWREVVYPKSLRQDSLVRWKRSLHASRSSSDDPPPQQQAAKPKVS